MNDIDLGGYANWNPIGNANNLYFSGTFDGNWFVIKNLKITASSSYRGLFGVLSNATIKQLGITGCDISGYQNVGGLAGVCTGNNAINYCYVTGKVTGQNYVGGLVGQSSLGGIHNCYTNCEVSGLDAVGGLVGSNSATIYNSYTTGSVSGQSQVGGFVGLNNAYTTLTVNYTTCSVTATGTNAEIGGLIGKDLTNQDVKNCVAANTSVVATQTTSNINRIFGAVNDISLHKNNYALSTMIVTANGVNVALGTIGHNQKAGADATMSTLKSFDFYNTASNWNGGAWSIATAADNSKVWRISCDGTMLPFLQWQQGIVCPNACYTITPSVVGANGTISPNTPQTVAEGSNVTFTITAANNFYTINQVLIDNVPIDLSVLENGNQYTFYDLDANHTIAVSFKLAGFCGGTGTQLDPYQICDAASLAQLASFVNAGNGNATQNVYYKMTADIDLAGTAWGTNWTPIGSNFFNSSGYCFQGNFDGNNYAVRNLIITGGAYLGLFGGTTGNAYIQNLGIENCNITSSNAYVGGLVGTTNNSTFENCYVTGKVETTLSGNTEINIGGLIGNCGTSTAINKCYSTANVTGGGNNVGGLVGYIVASNINNCYTTGNVSGGTMVGGLVGMNHTSTIANCYATGSISGTVDYVGGIAGQNYGTTRNCVAANDKITVTATTSKINRISGPSGFAGEYFNNNYAFEDMIVTSGGNPANIGAPALNGHSGANATMEQLKSLSFYTTNSNWNATNPWSIATTASETASWRLCESPLHLPWLQWQGEKDCTPPPFVAVTNITGIPTVMLAGTTATLNGVVAPTDATNQEIVWTITTPGTTGATLNTGVVPNVLTVPTPGTLTLTATITNGLTPTTDYTQTFTIDVSNVIYIVDAPNQNGVNKFLWTEMPAALTALQDGWTLDISGATPETATRAIDFGNKNATLKAVTTKTYPLTISTTANLTLIDYNSTQSSSINPSIYMNPVAATATLNIVGNCNVISNYSAGSGDSNGGRALQATKNLIIDGNGTVLFSGGTNGMEFTAANVTLTVNANVTAEMNFKGSSTQQAGLVFRSTKVNINGSGTLTARALRNITASLYFINTTTLDATFSELSNLSIGSATGGAGILLGKYDGQTTTNHSLTFNLPNATNISGYNNVTGLDVAGAATCITTITNLGADITFTGNGTANGIAVPGTLTVNGPGKIFAKGGNRGIHLGGNTLTINTDVTAESTNTTGAAYGIYLNVANSTITGSGNLTAKGTGATSSGEGILVSQANATLNISKLASLNVSAVNANGINFPGTGNHKLIFELPNETTINGGTAGAGVAFNGSAGSAHTFTNNGNIINSNGATGIYSNYNLTFNGTGSIHATGSNIRGIYMFNSNMNITLGESVTVTAQGTTPVALSGTGSVIFSTVNHKLIVFNVSTTAQTIPCTKPATLPPYWSVIGNGTITTGDETTTQMNYTVASTGKASVQLTQTTPTRTITVITGGNGTVSPYPTVTVPYGGSQTFTITPDNCHIIGEILVNNLPIVPPTTTYTFTNVKENQTIDVTFKPAILTEEITETICEGETYDFYGEAYPAGTHEIVVENPDGCPVKYILTVTANPHTSESVYKTICEGGSYFFSGEELTQTGVYQMFTENQYGCVHTTTLYLTVNNIEIINTFGEICENSLYEFLGEYYPAGIHTIVVEIPDECPVKYILTVTANPHTSESIYKTICEGSSFFFNGEERTEEGEYVMYTENQYGCKHFTTLYLTVNNIEIINTFGEICEGGVFAFLGETYPAGVHTIMVEIPDECPVKYILTVTANPHTSESVYKTICEGSSFFFNGEELTQEGTYQMFTENQYGCVHTTTLYLTVNNIEIINTFGEICEGGVYAFLGETYPVGVHTIMVEIPDECPVKYILTVTANPHTSESVYKTICEGGSFFFNGEELTQEGTYQMFTENQYGCVHTTTLYLTVSDIEIINTFGEICEGGVFAFLGETYPAGVHTIMVEIPNECPVKYILTVTANPHTSESIYKTICEGGSFFFNGEERSEEGEYVMYTENQYGCVHTTTLYLTVSDIEIINTFGEICEGGVYAFLGETYPAGVHTIMVEIPNECPVKYILTVTANPHTSESIYKTICEGSSFIFNGEERTEEGIYRMFTENQYGCVHTTTLYLTVSDIEIINTFGEICEGGVFAFLGETYPVGVHTIMVEIPDECPVKYILTVTANPHTSESVYKTICEGGSYFFNGEELTQEGEYQMFTLNQYGCVHTTTLYLTVSDIEIINTFGEICEGGVFAFLGETYPAGVHTIMVEIPDECPVKYILTVTANPHTSESVYKTICEGSSYLFNGEALTQEGEYVMYTENQYGCVHTTTLYLTVSGKDTTKIAATIFYGETYNFYGQLLTTEGIYTHTLQTIHDCDSVIELTLSVITTGYTIIATATGNGTITPAGTINVQQGETITFYFTPDADYRIESVLVDGKNQNSAVGQGSYTFKNIRQNHTIEVVFTHVKYTITATAGPNGTITPEGVIMVEEGGTATFYFTPFAGYSIQEVLVNGKSDNKAAKDGFVTLKNIKSNQTVHVTFVSNALTVTATAGPNGTITPKGVITVEEGGSATFTFTPFAGYVIQEVLVNGKKDNKAAKDGFITLKNIKSNQTVHVTFNAVSNTPPLDITETDIHNVTVYSHQNTVYVKNQNAVALQSIIITDMIGRVVYQSKVSLPEPVITLDVSAGIYIVRLISQTNSTIISKVSLTKF